MAAVSDDDAWEAWLGMLLSIHCHAQPSLCTSQRHFVDPLGVLHDRELISGSAGRLRSWIIWS